jgi:pimeloyl-ACP methyl ester carboxylesterase
MRKLLRLVLLLALLAGAGFATPTARAQSTSAIPGPCETGEFPTGALWMICVPQSGWNGDLVIWAHGYVAFNQPIDFYSLTLPDGSSLPDLIQSLGYAFATTSYRQNGLAILEGVEDVGDVAQHFGDLHGTPGHTYLTGASEGGIVTTLAIERHPELYSGGLGACGPIGNFRQQLNYWGDFRVLFDYFFPGVIPGSPIAIPPEVIAGWESTYIPAIKAALAAKPGAARELISTSKAPIDLANPATVETTTLNLLWYNVFATNDGIAKLGGSPYDNRDRWYWGSSNDLRLNLRVRRFSADPQALEQVKRYETSGRLTRPLVTLHTTGDEIIPYWHELYYVAKARPSGNGSLVPIPVFRYGHCNFTSLEVLGAFGLLVLQVGGSQPQGLPQVFTADQARRDFAQAQRDFARTQQIEYLQKKGEFEGASPLKEPTHIVK